MTVTIAQAWQVVGEEQSRSVTNPVPSGRACRAQVRPPSAVVRASGRSAPSRVMPTQRVRVVQVSSVTVPREAGTATGSHGLPPVVVWKAAPLRPTLAQVVTVGQEAAVHPTKAVGSAWEAQLAPASLVAKTSGQLNCEPKAQQVSSVGQETERRAPEVVPTGFLAQVAPPSVVAATATDPLWLPTA